MWEGQKSGTQNLLHRAKVTFTNSTMWILNLPFLTPFLKKHDMSLYLTFYVENGVFPNQ